MSATTTSQYRTAEAAAKALDDRSACATYPSDWFFGTGKNYQDIHNRALLVCGTCPVQDACRDYGEHINAKDGVWAGLEVGPTGTLRSARRVPLAEERRSKLLRRAARWMARARFEQRRGRYPTRTQTDQQLVDQLTSEVLQQVRSGEVPEELREEAQRWDEVRDLVVEDDDTFPPEFVAAVERAFWALPRPDASDVA